MDDEAISELLEALSDADQQRRTARQLSCLRGIRGTPSSEVARVAAACWEESPVGLPEDAEALTRLFGTAWEDGLVAIGLLATVVPDDPEAALELGLEWLERVDDLQTADALGGLVLGPAALSVGRTLPLEGRVEIRRAIAATGLAMLPISAQGPSVAPLRSRLGARIIRFVDEPQEGPLGVLMDRVVRDEAPPLRKMARRLLREWRKLDPGQVAAWADRSPSTRGGLQRMLQDEVNRARRQA